MKKNFWAVALSLLLVFSLSASAVWFVSAKYVSRASIAATVNIRNRVTVTFDMNGLAADLSREIRTVSRVSEPSAQDMGLTQVEYLDGEDELQGVGLEYDEIFYVFDGWYSDSQTSTETDFSRNISSNTTFYSKWIQLCEISFDMDGHAADKESYYIKNNTKIECPEAPAPSDDYTFGGWYEDENRQTLFDFDEEIEENTVLYAKWIEPQEPEEPAPNEGDPDGEGQGNGRSVQNDEQDGEIPVNGENDQQEPPEGGQDVDPPQVPEGDDQGEDPLAEGQEQPTGQEPDQQQGQGQGEPEPAAPNDPPEPSGNEEPEEPANEP